MPFLCVQRSDVQLVVCKLQATHVSFLEQTASGRRTYSAFQAFADTVWGEVRSRSCLREFCWRIVCALFAKRVKYRDDFRADVCGSIEISVLFYRESRWVSA